MKKIFSTEVSGSRDVILLVLRVAIAAMMLAHGIPKLQMLLSGGSAAFPGVLGMAPALALTLAVFAEVVCSLFILFGLGTRLAAIPLIITMLVAVLIVHANDPFARQELGVHYLLFYVVLLFAGSGKYSADYYISGKTGRAASFQRAD
jgi:putative oxidoreductase